MLALRRNAALEIVREGECLGCFPMEKVYNLFLRLQHRWALHPSSKGAAYPSCSHSQPELVISLPLLWLFLSDTQHMSLGNFLVFCARILWD